MKGVYSRDKMKHNEMSDQLLLARLMGQYCFARWHLSSSSVTLPAGGPAAGHVGGRAADTARRASTVTSC